MKNEILKTRAFGSTSRQKVLPRPLLDSVASIIIPGIIFPNFFQEICVIITKYVNSIMCLPIVDGT